MKYLPGFLIVIFWSLATPTFAHTVGRERVECPLCHKRFWAAVDLSYTESGARLDSKPLGALSAPRLLPVCPRCHFVSVTEVYPETKQQRKMLRTFVATREYRTLAHQRNGYFLLARLLERCKRSPIRVAFAYLQGSWMAEGKSGYRLYLQNCRQQLAKFIAAPSGYELTQSEPLLYGELLRLLADFASADHYFHRLKQDSNFADPYYQALLSYELDLIEKRDSKPKALPDNLPPFPNKERLAALDASRHLEGYGELSDSWKIVDAWLGHVNWFPYVLFTQLEATNNPIVNRAWWLSSADKDGPTSNWKAFLAAHAEVEEVVAKYQWLIDWRKAEPGRQIEAQIYERTPNTELPTDAWKQAGLKGDPYYELQLRGGSEARIYFGKDDPRALITSARAVPEAAAKHWLDRLKIFYFHGEKPGEFVVVNPNGEWTPNSPSEK